MQLPLQDFSALVRTQAAAVRGAARGAGLGFPTAMQPMNPMLANWMNIHTDGFAHDAFTQNALSMGMQADFNATYGTQLQASPVDFAINTSSAAMMSSMSMAPFTMMPTTIDMPGMSAAPFQMADFQQEFHNTNLANADFTARSCAAAARMAFLVTGRTGAGGGFGSPTGTSRPSSSGRRYSPV